jgi:RND family efflux transporter MFP subunit
MFETEVPMSLRPGSWWWLLSIGCADASALQEAASPEVVAVRTAPVAEAPVARPLHGSGRLRATTEATLSFPFGGVVADVVVSRGQVVHKGELLAVLDAAPARAQLAAATSAAQKAARDAARAEALGGAVSTAQQQDARTGLEVAQADLDAARFQARRSVLVAPADGTVLDVFVDDGQTAGAGQPVLRFAGAEGYEVELVLSAADALAAAPGTPAAATIRSAGVALPGVVTERAGGAGPLGGFTVVVGLEATDAVLAPGLVATVDLAPAPSVRRTVPIEALAEADGSDGAVYVLDGDHVRRVPVTIAFLAGALVALDDGPPAGSEVVVEGVPFVVDGGAVVVR